MIQKQAYSSQQLALVYQAYVASFSSNTFAQRLYTEADFCSMIQNNAGQDTRTKLYVNWQEQEVAAFLLFQDLGNNSEALCEILQIASQPKWRSKSMASALLHSMLEDYSSAELWLEVNELNLNAIQFYKAHGFSPCGKRPNYYPNSAAAILMSRPVKS